jgi:hypothetical protein
VRGHNDRSVDTRAVTGESVSDELSTSEEWALDIELERFKGELRELLERHSAAEVAEILAERRRQRNASREDCPGLDLGN